MTRTIADGHTTGDSPTTPQPYTKRHFRFEGPLAREGFRVKIYSIRVSDDPIEPSTLDAARTFALRHLIAAAQDEGDHHGLGFAILHEGKDATWLLMDWWAHGDILCQRIAVSRDGKPFAITGRPFHACVWEGVVIAHEHRAWIDSMLTERPDPERYLAASLAAGTY